jgi:hypothetical protein
MKDHTKISKFTVFQNVWTNTNWVARFKKNIKIRENAWFWGTPSWKPIHSLLFVRHLKACHSVSMHPHILNLGTFTNFSVIFLCGGVCFLIRLIFSLGPSPFLNSEMANKWQTFHFFPTGAVWRLFSGVTIIHFQVNIYMNLRSCVDR